jgi:hypothetical protein
MQKQTMGSQFLRCRDTENALAGGTRRTNLQRTMRTEFMRLIILLSATMAGFDSGAATMVLTPVADTSLFEGAADNNMGGHESLAAGGNAGGVSFRALLKFDVAGSLPPGAIIQSASLQLSILKSPGAASPSTFAVHRVLRQWGEGDKGSGLTGIGAIASDGEATWNSRLHPGTMWDASGGQAGTDFTSAASAATSEQVQGFGTADFVSTPVLIADVRQWLVDPDSNFGWLLKSDSEDSPFTARRFGSSEAASGQPTLTIEAILLPRIGPTLVADGQFSLQFDGEAGKGYVVERRTQLDSGEWTVLTNVPPLEVSGTVSVLDPVTSGSQFYRLGELPIPGLRSGN